MSAAHTEILVDTAAVAAAAARGRRVWSELIGHPGVLFGGGVLVLMSMVALVAPLLGTVDPAIIDPTHRNQLPGSEWTVTSVSGHELARTAWMGTDSLGRDLYSRVVYGARVSLIIGVAVAVPSIVVGLAIGLASGYFRWLDAVVMRVMDGLMRSSRSCS